MPPGASQQIRLEADDRKLIEAADKLGIDRLACSILTPKRPSTAEGFRECNQWMAEALRRSRPRDGLLLREPRLRARGAR